MASLKKKQINSLRNVCYLHNCVSPINTSVVIATAEGILTSIDGNLLASNGGGISLNKDWAKSSHI